MRPAGGLWRNSFGSLLALGPADADGFSRGAYASTTGATGTYPVVAVRSPGRDGEGEAAACCVSWRSLGPEPADPSWHWSSALGGQLIGGRLELSHLLNVSAPLADLVPEGRWVDELVYENLGDDAAAPVLEAPVLAALRAPRREAGGRSWTGADAKLRLGGAGAALGFVRGTLAWNGNEWELAGFVDAWDGEPVPGKLSASLVGFSAGSPGRCVALGGFLDPASGGADLMLLANRATAPDWAYTQSSLHALTLGRAR